jgi:hypothetical protein
MRGGAMLPRLNVRQCWSGGDTTGNREGITVWCLCHSFPSLPLLTLHWVF